MSFPSIEAIRNGLELDDEAAQHVLEAMHLTDARKPVAPYIAEVLAQLGRRVDSVNDRRQVAMEIINVLTEGHGTEALFEDGEAWPYVEYVNMGDPYVTTVVYDWENDEFSIEGWGDFQERHEMSGGDDRDLDEDEEKVASMIAQTLWLDALHSAAEYAVEDKKMASAEHARFIEEASDEVPASVQEEAEEFLGECEQHNGMNVHDLLEDLGEPIDDENLDALGYYIAMQMLGHGVAWSDDHEAELKTPSREANVSYSEAEDALDTFLAIGADRDDEDDEPAENPKGGRYHVRTTRGNEVYGPYALRSAKYFAMIGSRHGSPREVWKGRKRIRRYEDGERVWPTSLKQTHGFTPGEIPRSLR